MPQASSETTSMKEIVVPSTFENGSSSDASMLSTAATVASNPPEAIAPQTGTTRMAKNIMTPWMKSVRETARKPPTSV